MESTATKGRAPARSTRLTGRDYVVLAVFGVLLFAVFMVFSIVCSLSATTSWFTHGVGAVPAGIVWMYVLARVPKRGAVALMCLLVALLGLVMGMFWTGPLGIALGGVAAELVLGAP
ncbi:MptD family putative ECF transporter S component, partial [Alistipes onderdonkii]|nr:MptD family putative ECF transporter S component [Alistipes onderdonkii]